MFSRACAVRPRQRDRSIVPTAGQLRVLGKSACSFGGNFRRIRGNSVRGHIGSIVRCCDDCIFHAWGALSLGAFQRGTLSPLGTMPRTGPHDAVLAPAHLRFNQ